jgi:uncharacterized damage-inducible protein DinB
MNYYSAKELAASFRTVRKNTILVAEDVPEDKFTFRAFPEGRSVGELLAHLVVSCAWQYQLHAVDRRSSFEGFDFVSAIQKSAAEENQPRSKARLIELFTGSGEKWAAYIEGLGEDFLAERAQMAAGSVPPSRSRFEMILGVKKHEMHHRGQRMLIERLCGIVPHMTRDIQAHLVASELPN